MKIGFGKLKTQAVIPEEKAGIIPLVTPVPLEIQAGEKVDLKTELVVRVPVGYILSIQSSPTLLAVSGLEVLGPTFVTSEDEGGITIPLYNTSNRQLNLQARSQVAVAFLVGLEPVEIEEFSPEKKETKRPAARKAGKGDPFKFEVS